jgi:hypothetical protein
VSSTGDATPTMHDLQRTSHQTRQSSAVCCNVCYTLQHLLGADLDVCREEAIQSGKIELLRALKMASFGSVSDESTVCLSLFMLGCSSNVVPDLQR